MARPADNIRLTTAQREEIEEAFTLFDIDNDEHLDFHEFRVALRAMGFKVPRPEIKQMLEAYGVLPALNTQPIGAAASKTTAQPSQPPHVSQLRLPRARFIHIAAMKVAARNPQEEAERAFNQFDKDGKGYVTFEDLKRMVQTLGENRLSDEELRAMVDEYDYDGIGGVTRESFLAMLLG